MIRWIKRWFKKDIQLNGKGEIFNPIFRKVINVTKAPNTLSNG
jgi:hypothetical protein